MPFSALTRNTRLVRPPNRDSINCWAWEESAAGFAKPWVFSLPKAVKPSAPAPIMTSTVTTRTARAWFVTNCPIRPNISCSPCR